MRIRARSARYTRMVRHLHLIRCLRAFEQVRPVCQRIYQVHGAAMRILNQLLQQMPTQLMLEVEQPLPHERDQPADTLRLGAPFRLDRRNTNRSVIKFRAEQQFSKWQVDFL